MLKAVTWSDYEKYGCVECGCEYCYADYISGPSTPVICGECQSKFVILADGLTKSNLGFGTNKKDDKGETIFEYPILGKHPREGIEKHKYVRPDVRPENGIGEFANPRGVGYDVACFVKSKEAGVRIVSMFEKISKEYEESDKKFGFSCWLDYRPTEPKWIQVKINYPNEDRASLLCALLNNNGNIITEDIIRLANDMKLTFEDKYKLFSINPLLLNYDFNHKLMMLVNNYGSNTHDRERVEELYSKNYNLLAQFEMFGTGLQVHNSVYGGDLETAKMSLINFIDKYNDPFTCQLRVKGTGQKSWQIQSNAEVRNFSNSAIELCNMGESKENKVEFITENEDLIPSDFQSIDIPMTRDERYEFITKFKLELEPLILDYVDWSFIKKVLNGIENLSRTDSIMTKDTKIKIEALINSSKNKNFIAMFSLAGLLYQVHGEINRKYSVEENEHFVDAILAASHTLEQLESPTIFHIEKTRNSEEQNEIYKQIQMKLQELSARYRTLLFNEKIDEKHLTLKKEI